MCHARWRSSPEAKCRSCELMAAALKLEGAVQRIRQLAHLRLSWLLESLGRFSVQGRRVASSWASPSAKVDEEDAALLPEQQKAMCLQWQGQH